jgi:hypothetical protein
VPVSAIRWLLVPAVVAGLSCSTSSDPEVFSDIGLTRLVFVDPALTFPRVTGDTQLQVVEWRLQAATVQLDGGVAHDLLGNESCVMTDIASISTLVQGACSGGVVLESSALPQLAQLELAFTMEVRRAKPASLSSEGDADRDGIADDGDASGSAFDEPCAPGASTGCDDNCPLVANADQADAIADGPGDACSVLGVIDSDADGDIDSLDNCPAVFNPLQTTTKSININIIGDACRETARVHLEGNFQIQLTPPVAALLQPTGRLRLLTVDFNHLRTLECDWPFGICSLNGDAVRLCVTACGQETASSCLARASILGCLE